MEIRSSLLLRTSFWIFSIYKPGTMTKAVERNNYCCAWRESLRRNCLTETTRTRWRRAILTKSKSRLRSSSLVTRCCDLPWIAASSISSSSGSRQIFNSPEVSTTSARAAIRRTNVSASRWVYLNLRSIVDGRELLPTRRAARVT